MKQLKNLYSDARTRLLPGDVCRNYFLVGATWTSPFGSTPTSGIINNHEAGTARLSNATMETFTQATSASSINQAGFNCFSCHNRGVDNSTGTFDGQPMPHFKDVSHVFGKQIAN